MSSLQVSDDPLSGSVQKVDRDDFNVIDEINSHRV